MRYLGIDLGCKSAGLSITDKTNTLVRPLNVIKFEFENYEKALEEIIKVIHDNEVELVILGYPKNFEVTISDINIYNGAGFITILLGNVLTMPGLAKNSNYLNMKIENGKIIGIK